jgi:hypothetical protein
MHTQRTRFLLSFLFVSGALSACNNPPPSDKPTPMAANGMQGAGQTAAAGGGPVLAGAKAGAGGSSQSTGTGQTAAGGGAGSAGRNTGSAGAWGAAGKPATAESGAAAMPASMSGNRAGAAGAPTSGAAGSGKSSGAAALVKPPCLKKNSQVVVVGDSYLNWITHNFPEDFRSEFGDYRVYAVGGASMASGGIAGFIPDQLTMAIMEDPDITVGVMTGGGNDILIADTVMYPESDTCKDRTDAPTVQVCKDVIANAMETAKKLMQTAGNAGMKDVIYVFYPHIPGGGFGGMSPNSILEYSLPLARDLCEQAEATTGGKLRCHFLDLQPVFKDHPVDWFADDGIHENEKGSAQMAKEVVAIFKDKCIAQPESSGCCAP